MKLWECSDGPISLWFNLTYAAYLTLPRSILESMPEEWQNRFAKCLNELDDTFTGWPQKSHYEVRLRSDNGRFMNDPLREYRHPDHELIESLLAASGGKED